MWTKVLKSLLILIGVLAIVLAMGPRPDFPQYDLSPMYLKVQLVDIDTYVAANESAISDLKPDNQARVIWDQDTIRKTEYSLVYLHGFSASQEEGNPVHRLVAERYGMNLYLARIADHGRSVDDTFKDLTPKDLIASAKEAIAIGALLGEKVIVMSCSTGSTYAIMLAPDDNRIHSMLMYSPNIGIKDPSAALTTYPWGKQLMTAVMGGEYNHIQYPEAAQQYWNKTYHTDGIIAMQSLLDDGMQEEYFEQVDQPFFLGCYYKNEESQDQVVSVDRMQDFFDQSGTADSLKQMIRFPDAGRHVFTSRTMVSDVETVADATFAYIEDVLHIRPVQ